MGIKDRVADWISDENDTDIEQEKDLLDDSLRGDPPEPYDTLEEQSGTDIATRLLDMSHDKRVEFLRDDKFVYHHWKKTRDTIDGNPDLRNEFGLDEQQRADYNGTTVCLNHEKPGPVGQIEYGQENKQTVGHKQRDTDKRSVNFNTEVDIGSNSWIPAGGKGGINGGTGTDDMQEAYAQHTNTSKPLMMDVCKVDRAECATSKKALYNAFCARSRILRSKYSDGKDFEIGEKRIDMEFGTDASTQKTDDTTETQQAETEPAEKTTSNVNGQPDGVADGTDTDEDSSVTSETDNIVADSFYNQKTDATADNTSASAASASRSDSGSGESTDKQSFTEDDEQAQSTSSRPRNTDIKADRSEGQTTRTNNESTANGSGWTFGDSDASDIRTKSNNTNNNSENSNL